METRDRNKRGAEEDLCRTEDGDANKSTNARNISFDIKANESVASFQP